MKHTILLSAALIGGLAATAAGQLAPAKWADTLSSEIDRAQLAGDPAKLDAAAALASRVATAYPADGLILHYQGYALYRQAIGKTARGGDAGPELREAQRLLERSLKLAPIPETQSLLASIEGQLIASDPSSAMELGMASQAASSAALSMGPNNPRVWLLRGQATMFTPPEYGGSVETARQQLEHAVTLFATDTPKPGYPSWGKAEAFVWVGQAYEKAGDKTKASAMYKQALEIAPNYSYARALSAALK